MRRWRLALLLLLPCLSGCTFALEEGWQDSMRVFEFSSTKHKPTTVAYCEPAGN